MSEWIKVEDEPQPKCNHLVLLEDGEVHGARTTGVDGCVLVIGSYFSFDMPKVTHWMPLPEPPQEGV